MSVKVPGNESARERIGQSPVGRFTPGSELAWDRKGCGVLNTDPKTTDLTLSIFCLVQIASLVMSVFNLVSDS